MYILYRLHGEHNINKSYEVLFNYTHIDSIFKVFVFF